MKAVQIIARGKPVFVDAPKPTLQPRTGLVRSLRLSLCGSDVRHLHYLPAERYPTATGETGHEMVGVVEAIDPHNGSVQPGDRVLCLAPDHRAMCEYYLAPIDRLLPLDPATPLEHSVQAQQFGTVLYAARVLPDLRGKTVAVIGQGSAGLWFNFALQQRGAAKIIALDLKAYRLAYSQRFGATHTIHNADISAARRPARNQRRRAARCGHRGGRRRRVHPPGGRDCARGRLRAAIRRAALRYHGRLPHLRGFLEDPDAQIDGGHDRRPRPRLHAPERWSTSTPARSMWAG